MKFLPTISIVPPTPAAISFAVPISYEFRVVEYTEMDKVIKARMEFKINQHDQYGNISISGDWKEVDRIQMPLDKEQK